MAEKNEYSSVRVTLRSGRELEEELESGMRRNLLSYTTTFTEVVRYIVVNAD